MTLKEAITIKYPAYSEKLAERFMEANGVELAWENISKATLARFCEYIQTIVARSTARFYCAAIKSTLSLYDDEHPLPNGWRDAMRVKKEDSEQVYLSEDEIMKLMSYTPKNLNEEYSLTTFLLGCLSGARHSDYVRFTEENINEGFLRYTSQKTRTSACLPIAPAVPRLLKQMASLKNVEIADSTFNDCIRRICKNAGITTSLKLYRRGKETTAQKWEFISSHTARRSFASNLYLRGCDILSISMMMGHASVDMTRGYIVCGLREMPKSVTEYFTKFD